MNEVIAESLGCCLVRMMGVRAWSITLSFDLLQKVCKVSGLGNGAQREGAQGPGVSPWCWQMGRKFVRSASPCHRADREVRSGDILIPLHFPRLPFLGETRGSPPPHPTRPRHVIVKGRESSPFLPGEVRGKVLCKESGTTFSRHPAGWVGTTAHFSHPYFQVCHVCLVHHLIILKKYIKAV